MKVCFETFGCRLNKAEALQMEADYLARGWTLTDKHAQANLIIVRGCSVTRRAEHECLNLVTHLRRHYPGAVVQICGCLKPDSGGTTTPKAKALLAQKLNTNAAKTLPTRTARAYLKVQDGCAGRCSFCIVPKFRGASRSEDFVELLDKSRRFIDAGYHEIVVTGCNLSLYASQGKRLPDLVAALAELSPDCRIRIGSLEPGSCALETIPVMSEHANVCRFLHLPIQSGSNVMLKAMQRPYTVNEVEKAVELATQRMPHLGLGCDLMTGFPGETNADFASTLNLVNRLPLTNAHVFPFSRRPGTIATALPSQVEKIIRSERARKLSDAIRLLRQKYADSFVGKIVEIIVENDKKCCGWTSEYLTCEAFGSAPRKAIARIRVNRASSDKLFGQLVRE